MNTTSPDPPDDRFVDELCDYQAQLEGADPASTAMTSASTTDRDLQDRLDACRHCLDALHTVRMNIASPEPAEVHIGRYAVPRSIGRFEITGEPKSGGFGIVFPGFDPIMQRNVAIKIPKPEYLLAPALLERFRREAQAVSQIEHANVVPVFEVGQDGATPYLVMPYVRGETLTAWRRAQSEVTPRLAAEIVRQIAEGVACAHSLKVLHRDIKPGNILLAPGPLDASDRGLGMIPKLTDFGLAKLLEADQPPTESRTVLGTAGYMSPEQLVGKTEQIGYPADVYSLGAVLYFLIAGEPPFSSAAEQAQYQPHDEPPSLRARGWNVPVDFEVLCRTCLEHSPARRYQSARQLADDLRRFLNGEPIQARPISTFRRIGKWCRRHPAWTVLTSVSTLSLVALVATSLWYNARLTRELQTSEAARKTAEFQEREIRRRAYVSDMALASRAWNNGNVDQVATLLNRYLPREGESDLRDFVWKYLWRQYSETSRVLGRHPGGATAAAMTPKGTWGASGGADGVIRLWALPAGTLHREIDEHGGRRINALDISPDGQRLASASDDGTLRVWEIPAGSQRFSRAAHDTGVTDVAFSPDGRLLASAGADHVIRLWDAETGEPTGELRGHTNAIERIAFHPEGAILASTSRDGTLRLWDVHRLAFDERLPEGVFYRTPSFWPRLVEFSPDGRHLVCATFTVRCFQWSLKPESFGQMEPLPAELAQPPENVRAMVWPRQGSLTWATMPIGVLATDVVTRLSGHSDSVLGLASDEIGTSILSASTDGEVRLWTRQSSRDVIQEPRPDHLPPRWAGSTFSGIGLNDQHLVSFSAGTYSFFSLADGSLQHNIHGEIEFPIGHCLPNHGQFVVSTCVSKALRCLSTENGKLLWNRMLPNHHPVQQYYLAIDPDDHFVAASHGNDVVILACTSGEVVHTLPHPDRTNELVFHKRPSAPLTLISACRDGSLRSWNLETGRLLRERKAHPGGAFTLALSNNGHMLASGGNDRFVRIWQPDTLEPISTLGLGGTQKLVFFGSKNYLLCGGSDLTLWDVADQTELLQFPRGYDKLVFAVSPDGKTLALIIPGQIDLIRDEP